MRARTWGVVLLVNALISAVVVLVVVLVFGQTPAPEPPQTPEIAASSPAVSASPSPSGGDLVAPTSPVIEPTPSPESLAYVVREGDTLSGIAYAFGVSIDTLLEANDLADPNLLHPGQTLLIPVPTPRLDTATPAMPSEEAQPTPQPEATPLPTPTSVGPPLVEIWAVNAPGEVQSETVIVGNRGGLADLSGWRLSDNEGNVFIFPALTLFTGGEVRVHSGPGSSTPSDLYWGRAKPAWSHSELVTLRDRQGEVVDTFVIP